MKFAVSFLRLRQASFVDVAQAAEELGYESLWSGEHIALPVEEYWKGYPGAQGPEQVPFKADSIFLIFPRLSFLQNLAFRTA